MLRTKKKLLTLAVSSLLTSTGGLAANVASADEGAFLELEEIIVTARKKQETLQDVPAAVTAFSFDKLQDAGIRDATGLATVTPNLVFDQIAGSPGSSGISLRGVSFQDVEKSFDPAIGLQFDDVFMGTANGQIFDLLGVERIEVLRGPQGTVFGKNTIGGLINIVMEQPKGELGGSIRVGAGSDGERRLDGLIDFGNETFAGRVMVGQYENDGYWTNIAPGNEGDAGAVDQLTARVNLLWNINDRISADYAFTRIENDSDTPPLLNTSKAGDAATGSLLTCVLAAQCAIDEDTPQTGDRYVVTQDGSADSFQDIDTHRLRVTADLNDNLALTYVAAYQDTDELQNQDFDATLVSVFQTLRDQQYEQTTHELRVNGDYEGFSFVAGGYYWDSNYQIQQNTLIFGAPSQTNGDHARESFSLFFEGDFDITEGLSATLGARYIDEEKTFGATDNATFSTLDDKSSDSWNDVIYRAILKYEFSEDVQTYLSYSTGFRSGGYNGRAQTPAVARESYDPEEVSNLEVGVKTTLLDGRMNLNASLFSASYDDKQEEIAAADPDAPTGISTFVRNASTADIQGLEFEMNVLLTESWQLGVYGGWLDAEYDDFTADLGLGDGIADRSDLILRRSPETSFGITSTYSTEIGPGVGTASFNYAWKDDYEIIFTNDAEGRIDAFGTLNATITYEISDVTFRLIGRNLTEEEHYTHSFVAGPNATGGNLFAFATPVAPRTYAIEVSWDFQ